MDPLRSKRCWMLNFQVFLWFIFWVNAIMLNPRNPGREGGRGGMVTCKFYCVHCYERQCHVCENKRSDQYTSRCWGNLICALHPASQKFLTCCAFEYMQFMTKPKTNETDSIVCGIQQIVDRHESEDRKKEEECLQRGGPWRSFALKYKRHNNRLAFEVLRHSTRALVVHVYSNNNNNNNNYNMYMAP